MTIKSAELRELLETALKSELSDRWPTIASFARVEIGKILDTLEHIQGLTAAGQISEDEAKVLLEMQLHTTRMVLLTQEGITRLAIERAVQHAMSVAARVVNAALGFPLIAEIGGSRDH